MKRHSTLSGYQGRVEIAAEGGAGRRAAKNADMPMNQSREAHLAALRRLRATFGFVEVLRTVDRDKGQDKSPGLALGEDACRN